MAAMGVEHSTGALARGEPGEKQEQPVSQALAIRLGCLTQPGLSHAVLCPTALRPTCSATKGQARLWLREKFSPITKSQAFAQCFGHANEGC